MNRQKIALIIASLSTVLVVLGWLIDEKLNYNFGSTILCVGIACGLVSYLFAGLGVAMRMAFSIGKIGWIAAPFPAGIFTGLITSVFAFFAILFIPIVPVYKAYRESGN